MAPGKAAKGARLPAILIVEDAADTLDLWKLAFQDAGFRVLTAASVREALAVLGGEEPVDVVVSDYWLGDGTADALLREATRRGTLRGAQALICTAFQSVDESAYAQVLHKPIAPDDLIERVRELLPTPPDSSEVA